MQENELLSRAAAIDPVALAEIYDRYSPELYAYALRQLGNPSLAEDCLSEIFTRFLAVLQKQHGPITHLRAYLYRMVHNWITDLYRRQPLPELEIPEQAQAPDDLLPPNAAETNRDQTLVRKALSRLTPDQRQVIVLRFLEEWELEEIAAAMQKPVGSVKSLQHRAIAALKRLLAKEFE
ncbi:MAG TPA: sigma-70 family RNA polymerase sigma factor [Longilinea sp.]|nr:sigma-70 family RNA polymerase sigma factor [Longilinea sp.]